MANVQPAQSSGSTMGITLPQESNIRSEIGKSRNAPIHEKEASAALEKLERLPAPLHSLAASGDIKAFKAAFSKNVEELFQFYSPSAEYPALYSINTMNKYGMTPLHTASYYGKLDIVYYLLHEGADPNMYSSFGQSVHSRTISSTTSSSASKVVSKNWATALHFAAANGHRNVVVLLLEMGAKATALDFKGYNASQIARMHGHKKTSGIIDFYTGKLPKSTATRREVASRIDVCRIAIEAARGRAIGSPGSRANMLQSEKSMERDTQTKDYENDTDSVRSITLDNNLQTSASDNESLAKYNVQKAARSSSISSIDDLVHINTEGIPLSEELNLVNLPETDDVTTEAEEELSVVQEQLRTASHTNINELPIISEIPLKKISKYSKTID